MSLIRYSHDANQTMPYAKVYFIHPNLKELYAEITWGDISAWLINKEKELGGYKGKFFDLDDWGAISFYPHVLNRAKVSYTELVHELNGWGSAFKREPKVESKVFRSHKEVCLEMFGEVAEQECFAISSVSQMTGEEVIALYELEGLSSDVLDNLFKLSDEEHHRVLDAIKGIRGEEG